MNDQHLAFKPGESAWTLEKIINEKGQSIINITMQKSAYRIK
ncbi:hypothetical protein ACOBV9_18515 (plasmid) [Pseudoalteromonas espejiana]